MYVGRKYFTERRNRVTKLCAWRNYWGSSKYLKEDYKTFGKENFRREIISVHLTQADVNYAEVEEQFARDVLKTRLSNGEPAYYNRNIMGKWFAAPSERGPAHNKGKPMSDEQKAKLRESAKGRKGTPHTAETKAKLSAAKKGKPRPAGIIDKMNAARLAKPAHNKGKPLSEEQKAKLSAAKTGIPSPLKGTTRSDDKKQFGRKLSPESIEKMKATKRARVEAGLHP